MDYRKLIQKCDIYQQGKNCIPESTISSYEQAFEIEHTHHSTAIEGNTLTLFEAMETYAVNKNLQSFADMIAELEEKQLDRYISMIG